MAYDKKFRLRIIEYSDCSRKLMSHTFAEVADTSIRRMLASDSAFGVRSQRYYAWKAEIEAKGKFEYHYPKTYKGKVDISRLNELLQKHPAPCMTRKDLKLEI